jgi:Zn finger protein HypA/HybF involved in hydrogenase expression
MNDETVKFLLPESPVNDDAKPMEMEPEPRRIKCARCQTWTEPTNGTGWCPECYDAFERRQDELDRQEAGR